MKTVLPASAHGRWIALRGGEDAVVHGEGAAEAAHAPGAVTAAKAPGTEIAVTSAPLGGTDRGHGATAAYARSQARAWAGILGPATILAALAPGG